MSSVARRVLLLVVFVGALAAAAAWWRDRHDPFADDEPPSWPPLQPTGTTTAATTTASTTTATSDPVDAPGDAPDASPDLAEVSASWRPAGDGIEPPTGFPVKAKDSSGIFHEPGGRFYDRTRPDRWYATADAAEADGYRRSKT